MEIFVNGEKQQAWTRKDDRDVQLKRFAWPLSGRVLSKEEAQRAMEAGAARSAVILVSLFAGVLVFALVVGSMDEEFHATALGILLVVLAMAAYMASGLWRDKARERRALARIDAEAARWAPPGLEIRLDEGGVTILGNAIPWPEFVVAKLYVRKSQDDGGFTSYIDCLEAQAAGVRIVFDRFALENGGRCAEAAYAKLVRERGALVASSPHERSDMREARDFQSAMKETPRPRHRSSYRRMIMRKSLAHDKSNFARRINPLTPFKSLPAKINNFRFSENHAFLLPVPRRCEGRIAIVMSVARNAVDEDGPTTTGMIPVRRSCVVLSPRRWRQVQVKLTSFAKATVANEHWFTEESAYKP